MDKPITRNGFIKFADYNQKLNFMDTALYLFGMKLYNQVGSIEFYDADFSNTFFVKSTLFNDRTLYDCMQIINEALS